MRMGERTMNKTRKRIELTDDKQHDSQYKPGVVFGRTTVDGGRRLQQAHGPDRDTIEIRERGKRDYDALIQ